ncbi:MAG: CHRD domain-containing protein [Acidimicrobiales bacterium]
MRRIIAVILSTVLAMVGLAVLPDVASADVQFVVQADVALSGDQEATPVETEMTGRARLSINANRLRLRLTVRNNSGEVKAAHIHCAAPGSNGPVGVNLEVKPFTKANGVVATAASPTPSPDNSCGWDGLADVAQAIQAGEAYVNVHTAAHGGGEIRGDLSASRFSIRTSAALAGDQEAPPVETEMTGQVRLSMNENRLRIRLTVRNNTGEIKAAHIHCAAPGENGGVGLAFFSGSFTRANGAVVNASATEPRPDNSCGWETLADVAQAIQAGEAYVNVHTAANGGGEIRGDLGPVQG